MKNLKKWLDQLDASQKKQIATIFNTIAAIVIVQVTFKLFESDIFISLFGLVLSFLLWYLSIKIVKGGAE